MPARKPRPADEKPQRERFIEAAQKLGTSENSDDFERAFRKVVKSTITGPESPSAISQSGELHRGQSRKR
jgi:hypothetical protein